MIVSNISEQQRVVDSLCQLFDDVSVVDRRANPSNGYRAVHVIVNHSGKLVEVQVRTELQHVWAELSEKYSDVIHPGIKYGRGNEQIVQSLLQTSKVISDVEGSEIEIDNLERGIAIAIAEEKYPREKQDEILALQTNIQRLKNEHSEYREKSARRLRQIVDKLQVEGDSNVISD